MIELAISLANAGSEAFTYKSIKADTICIHSDTDNSIEILKEINKAFKNKK